MAKSHRIMRVYLAFFCVFFSALFVPSAGIADEVRGEPGGLDPLGKEADQSFGLQVLEQYRLVGVVKDFEFGVELKIMPRRGKTTQVSGLMIGKDNGNGLKARIDFILPSLEKSSSVETFRLLWENGLNPRVWQSGGPQNFATDLMKPVEYLEDLVGSDVSTFELLMPFQYWQSFYYEGETEFRSRKTHVFWMYPPKGEDGLTGRLSGVRLYIDGEFHSMIRAEVFSSQKEHLKTLSLIDLKKVNGVWIPKELDVRNEQTRDKTRIKIVDATIGVDLFPYFLTPESLGSTIIGVPLDGENIGEPTPF